MDEYELPQDDFEIIKGSGKFLIRANTRLINEVLEIRRRAARNEVAHIDTTNGVVVPKNI
jgi:hypothetical protein